MSITPYIIVFIVTIISIIGLKPVSSIIGLVDLPSDRKQHTGSIPLIGGLAMFLGVSFGLYSLKLIQIEENLIFFFIGSLILNLKNKPLIR